MAQNCPELELVSCRWHGQLAGWWEAVIVRVDDGEFLGKGSILRFVKIESPEREPEAVLIAAADQVDVAEKTFHDAHARRNEAQFAYLREPSIMTPRRSRRQKTAEVVTLKILNTEGPLAGPPGSPNRMEPAANE